jgi:hypothetical protein
MAYYSGQAASFSELRSALKTAVELNGWLTSGDIIYKDDCFVKVTAFADELRIKGGTGASGGELIGGASADAYCRIKSIGRRHVTFPVNYNIHILEEQIYLIIQYGIDYYQWLAFGVVENIAGAGSGNWYGASVCHNPSDGGVTLNSTSGGEINFATPAAPFWNSGNYFYGRFRTSYVNISIDDMTWLGDMDINAPVVHYSIAPLLDRQPSSWNSEAILLPAHVWVPRASNKSSIVARLRGCRLLRINHYQPEQIIQIGHDKWKIYPFYRKNSAASWGGSGVDHTGTFGWAIRYDGV